MARIKSTNDPSTHQGIAVGDVWIHPETQEAKIWDGEQWGTPMDSDSDDEEESDETEEETDDFEDDGE